MEAVVIHGLEHLIHLSKIESKLNMNRIKYNKVYLMYTICWPNELMTMFIWLIGLYFKKSRSDLCIKHFFVESLILLEPDHCT